MEWVQRTLGLEAKQPALGDGLATSLPGGGGGGHRSRLASLRDKIAKAKTKPSLFNKTKPFFSGVHRFGVARFALFLGDPFHTLLNLSWWKFIAVFFVVYLVMFCAFAFIYWAMPAGCMHGVDGSFAHALWVSSRAASTLGFTTIYPDPDCAGPNLVVMFQVICSSLIDMCMLGIVFARFSAPFKRAQSIRFSSCATVTRHPSGFWAIKLRVANVRKHQLLKPEMKMIITAIDSITPSNYVFEHLAIEDPESQQTNLQLGFPATVVHVVRTDSPLYNLSLEEMETRMMEVLVFVDGVDAMTSKQMQARKAYSPGSMVLNEQFVDMHLEMRGGKLGLDFTHFDDTVCSTGELVAEYQVSPELRGLPMPEVQHYMQHMRHYTFRRLTEQRGTGAGAGPSANTTGGGKRGSTISSGGGGNAAAAAAVPSAGGMPAAAAASIELTTHTAAAGATGGGGEPSPNPFTNTGHSF